MHPDYEQYRPASDSDIKQLNVRTSPELIMKLKTLADLENDSIAALVTEGVARVIEDRVKSIDPQSRQKLEEKRRALEQECGALDDLISHIED